MTIDRPYAPRPTAVEGVAEQRGWTVRRWRIRLPEQTADPARFAPATAKALAALPSPAVAPGRAGLAFLIEHQGRGVDYVVLGWWSRGNELPLRLWVRDGEGWRKAKGEESVCVWDLDVIRREREHYVRHILADPDNPAFERWVSIAP